VICWITTLCIATELFKLLFMSGMFNHQLFTSRMYFEQALDGIMLRQWE